MQGVVEVAACGSTLGKTSENNLFIHGRKGVKAELPKSH